MVIMEQERLLDWVQGYVKGDYGATKTWDWVQGPVNGHYGARKALGLGSWLCKGRLWRKKDFWTGCGPFEW